MDCIENTKVPDHFVDQIINTPLVPPLYFWRDGNGCFVELTDEERQQIESREDVVK